MSKKITLLSIAALFVFLFVGLSEAAVRVRKLGSPKTAFYSPDIRTQDDLRKMLGVRRDAIRQVLTQVGWTGNVDDLIKALDSGPFEETTIGTGTQIPFMAYHKRGKFSAMRNVNYVGPPFEAYYVDFESGGTGYRFYAPKICSNFWIEERAIEKPAPPPEAPPPPPPPPPAPEAAPPPPPPPPPQVEAEKPHLFFIAPFVGKERRVEFDENGLLAGDCDTLVGVKGGVVPRFGTHGEAELALGIKFSVSDDNPDDLAAAGLPSHKDKDTTVFVDAALHGVFNNGFVGGGLSFWDLNNSDLRTVALLLQFGIGPPKVQFSMEARAPFEDFDDIRNNYMIWAGIRIRP